MGTIRKKHKAEPAALVLVVEILERRPPFSDGSKVRCTVVLRATPWLELVRRFSARIATNLRLGVTRG